MRMRIGRLSLTVLLVIIVLVLTILVYFEFWNYPFDRYGWYIEMGEKNFYAYNYDKTQTYAKKAGQINHGFEYYNLITKLAFARDDMESAQKYAVQLRTFNTTYAIVLSNINLAKVCIIQNEYGKAEKLLKESLILDPTNSYVKYYYGVLLLKQKNPKDAIIYFEESLLNVPDGREHLPTKTRIYAAESIAYEMLGDDDLALESRRKSADIHPYGNSNIRKLVGSPK
jgi:tetratricopeptide (TPR) repeat protein